MSWPSIPLKRIATLRAGGTPSVDEPSYWSDSDGGHAWSAISDMSSVDSVTTTARRISADGLRSARIKLGEPGTILFSMYASLGHTAWLKVPAAWNQAILGLLPDPTTDARFLRYSLVSLRPHLLEQARSNTQANLNAEQVGNLSIPRPPLDEQRRIADFLDTETRRIDDLLRRRGIQQAVLTERYRRVLDMSFDRERSTRCRIKDLLRSKPRYGVLVPEFVDNGVPFVRINDLADLPARAGELRKIPETLSQQYRTTIVRRNDILVSVVGSLGRSTVAPPVVIGANVNRPIAILRTRQDISPELLSAWMGSSMFETQAMRATGNDSAQRTLGMEDLGNFEITWPIDAAEQEKTLTELTEIQAAANSLRVSIDHQLALLAERRQALITAAVSGQIDVTTARGVSLLGGVAV